MKETSVALFVEQARVVIDHYRNQVRLKLEKPVKRLHFNWMARGEPMENEKLLKNWVKLTQALEGLANVAGVHEVEWNISTIMPYPSRLHHFNGIPPSRRPTIFYSLYSMDYDFRRRWIPKGMDPLRALCELKHYEENGGKVVLHWAFIEGQNDSEECVAQIVRAVTMTQLQTRFNLVRYNPYSAVQGKEPPEEVIQARFKQIKAAMLIPGSRIVPRVGFDVAASCGMFIQLKTEKK